MTHQKPRLVFAVAAIGRNRELGKGNELLWRIPDDLKRFKELTTGHPIILGRKTFESIIGYIGKPLPGRTNIVVTRDASWSYPDVITASSIEEALAKAAQLDPETASIGGGASIYEAALPLTDKLYLTLIDDENSEADSFFPPYEDEFTKRVFEEERELNGLKYQWIDLERA